jgi:hypothetical protein
MLTASPAIPLQFAQEAGRDLIDTGFDIHKPGPTTQWIGRKGGHGYHRFLDSQGKAVMTGCKKATRKAAKAGLLKKTV